jgi:hypothetical protein
VRVMIFTGTGNTFFCRSGPVAGQRHHRQRRTPRFRALGKRRLV